MNLSSKLKQYKNLHFVFIVATLLIAAILLVYFAQRAESRLDAQTSVEVESKAQASAELIGQAQAQAEIEADNADKIYIGGKWYRIRSGLDTTLLIGVDDYEVTENENAFFNQSQADFLLLVARDRETKESFAIQINRDTMTSVQILSVGGTVAGREDQQIALSHTYGTGGKDSCVNTVDAARYFLYDVPIDHYVAMTMDGVAILNDAVGGVTLHALQDIPSIEAVKGEEITLNGDAALEYVRARLSLDDDTNIARQNRQRQYIMAWAAQAEQNLTTGEQINSLVSALSEYLVTDCNVTELADLAGDISAISGAPIYTPEGEVVEGEQFMEFYADEAKLKELVIRLFYTEVEE